MVCPITQGDHKNNALQLVNQPTIKKQSESQYYHCCCCCCYYHYYYCYYRSYCISREAQPRRNVHWPRPSECLCICLSVPCRIPTLLHGPGCNLGEWQGCPLVAHCWADLQSVRDFVAMMTQRRTRNVSECLYSLYVWLLLHTFHYQFLK